MLIEPSMERLMIPDPLHPAVVHFPVVLAFLLPIFAAGALWTIRRGARVRRAWTIPVALAGALLLSTWAAVQTGEAQEDRVERVVADEPLDAHEEAAESFIVMTTVVVLVMAAGLLPGLAGKSARLLGTAGAVGIVAGAAWVGHSGGQLVYQHGAASAYAGTATHAAAGEVSRDGGDDDDR
jgi:uncharacterized membrane protein